MFEAIWDAFINSENAYQRVTRLHGHTEPISCLAFTTDGDVLASGGDDQAVRIWSVKNQKCRQTITDGNRWGQITCLKWLTSETPATLCFGTGRGRVLIYRRVRSAKLLVESSNTQVFAESDSVEAIAYDPIHQRLIASSHFGKLQAYSTEKIGTLNPLWSSSIESTIPRALHFVENSQTILIFGLEKGEIVARNAETSLRKWSKTLKSAIGSAVICSNERYMLVENLSTGFDLYRMDRTSPSRSFDISNKKRFIKEGRFGENSTTVICGSDHGKVYVFRVATGEKIQVLKHGDRESLVQMIDVATSSEQHLIASGSSDTPYEISIWAKPSVNSKRDHCPRRDTLTILNSAVLVIFAWWIVNAWGGPIFKMVGNTAISLGKITPLHVVPKFEDSKWHRVVEAQQIEEDAEGEKRGAKIHAILQKRRDARAIAAL